MLLLVKSVPFAHSMTEEAAVADVNSDYSCRLNLLSCWQTEPEALRRTWSPLKSRPAAHNATWQGRAVKARRTKLQLPLFCHRGSLCSAANRIRSERFHVEKVGLDLFHASQPRPCCVIFSHVLIATGPTCPCRNHPIHAPHHQLCNHRQMRVFIFVSLKHRSFFRLQIYFRKTNMLNNETRVIFRMRKKHWLSLNNTVNKCHC